MVAHFDNSDSNPRNPHRPPQTVRWGEQTTDEMCIAFVEMAPKAEARSADDLKLPSQATVAALLLRERFFGSQGAAAGQAGQVSEKKPGALTKFAERLREAFGQKSANPSKE